MDDQFQRPAVAGDVSQLQAECDLRWSLRGVEGECLGVPRTGRATTGMVPGAGELDVGQLSPGEDPGDGLPGSGELSLVGGRDCQAAGGAYSLLSDGPVPEAMSLDHVLPATPSTGVPTVLDWQISDLKIYPVANPTTCGPVIKHTLVCGTYNSPWLVMDEHGDVETWDEVECRRVAALQPVDMQVTFARLCLDMIARGQVRPKVEETQQEKFSYPGIPQQMPGGGYAHEDYKKIVCRTRTRIFEGQRWCIVPGCCAECPLYGPCGVEDWSACAPSGSRLGLSPDQENVGPDGLESLEPQTGD